MSGAPPAAAFPLSMRGLLPCPSCASLLCDSSPKATSCRHPIRGTPGPCSVSRPGSPLSLCSCSPHPQNPLQNGLRTRFKNLGGPNSACKITAAVALVGSAAAAPSSLPWRSKPHLPRLPGSSGCCGWPAGSSCSAALVRYSRCVSGPHRTAECTAATPGSGPVIDLALGLAPCLKPPPSPTALLLVQDCSSSNVTVVAGTVGYLVRMGNGAA